MNDFQVKLDQTLARLWLVKVMQQQGKDPNATKCPYCGHGASFAALGALAEMLGVNSILDDMDNFQRYLVAEARDAVKEVDDQINVNLFWRDLVDGITGGAVGVSANDLKRFFKVVENRRATPPVSTLQIKAGEDSSYCAWISYLLYINIGPVIDLLRAYERRQGRDLPLDRSDLRNQMKVRDYWAAPNADVHRQRFAGKKSNTACWCIDLNKHELGYRPVSDEEFLASLKANSDEKGLSIPQADWVDPRKGDLFAIIVDAVVEKQEKCDEP